jgi:hypothetical protein
MNPCRRIATVLILSLASTFAFAASLDPLHNHCAIGASEEPGKLQLHIGDRDCRTGNCNFSNSSETLDRFTGFTIADLGREGAELTATIAAEAGRFTCTGKVHDAWLEGESQFTPNQEFVSRMAQMGFDGFDSEKLLAATFIGVDTAWVRTMQQTGIRGMTTDNVIALRIFKADPAYIQSITALGYAMPDADQLVGLRLQGVDPQEVREIRALGYQPTLDELVQIRIFKVTPDFIRRMQARGFKNLSIAKLVQIRIFNLAD